MSESETQAVTVCVENSKILCIEEPSVLSAGYDWQIFNILSSSFTLNINISIFNPHSYS